jgi:hypothetical protein
MKKVIFFSCMLLACSTGYTQGKAKFSSQIAAGLLVGETNTEFQLQTINGLKWKKWFGGIGAGIDWYNVRTVPVFASVNRDIYKKGKNIFLLTGDIGVNFPWAQSYMSYLDFSYGSDYKPGLYWASGVGYKFGVGKGDNALMMNFGYSYKQSKQEISNLYPCFNPPCTPSVETYDYRLKRLSIRLGWIF